MSVSISGDGALTGIDQGFNVVGVVTASTINAVNGVFSGNVSVAGTVTYEDVTNVDSVGVITARSGIVVGTGTSISSPTTNMLALGTNNAERVRVGSGGHVGILSTLSIGTNTQVTSSTGLNPVITVGSATTSRLVWGTPGSDNYRLNISGGGALVFGVDGDSENFAIEGHQTGVQHLKYFGIDNYGRVTKPYQPGFFATGTASAANQPGSGEGDDLGPRFNNVAHSGGFNTGNHYNTTTGVFTAPVAGKYYTFFNMRWETGNFVQNNYIRIYISRNNSQTLHIHQINGSNEAWSNYMAMSCSGVISLAAGDTLRPKGGMNGGVAVGWWNESSWGAWLLG